jgi:quinate dehydrogenase (quinone)
MWTTASYDDELGLIYLPLGNATPDYYGVDRPANSDEYNSSLVALDVATGRERWHFRTVNHDLWDYDLPSQPALMDIPDGQGGVTRAVLQTTKRGQIFLLDRANGKPLADVIEKPVAQSGAVPEEKLASSQPYSVGMPTIGAETLTEQKTWGITMFDQLYCRIAFKRLRYDGDFTPIGLTPAIQQPGNFGGFNWGSVSVDALNSRVFLNDIRIPSVFYLVKRDQFAEATKNIHSDGAGHGPSPQIGTPYGMVTGLWMSPLGIPCNRPPFGTIMSIDLKSRKVAWQTPAGTAEQLGPFGIPVGLPMTMGMPSYAGTMATAGGLVFFAGFQDFYIRAYDAETGMELWKHKLPVGSSATPMTYVSPKTGRQYVVVSVGGAAYSPHVGDYVIAFALPKKG